jgi:hypothetical protein
MIRKLSKSAYAPLPKVKLMLAMTLGLAALPGAASATNPASTRLDYHIELIDLDINDGITPGISSIDVWSMVNLDDTNVQNHDFGPLSLSDGSRVGSLQLDPLSGSLEVQAGSNGFVQSYIKLQSFLLTGNTGLRLTGTIQGSTSSNPSLIRSSIGFGKEADWWTHELASLYVHDSSATGSVSFDITTRNRGLNSVAYQLEARAFASFNQDIPPAIPEPESYALMLAGIAAFALRYRARKNIS